MIKCKTINNACPFEQERVEGWLNARQSLKRKRGKASRHSVVRKNTMAQDQADVANPPYATDKISSIQSQQRNKSDRRKLKTPRRTGYVCGMRTAQVLPPYWTTARGASDAPNSNAAPKISARKIHCWARVYHTVAGQTTIIRGRGGNIK